LIGQRFETVKALLHEAAERAIASLWDAIGKLVDLFARYALKVATVRKAFPAADHVVYLDSGFQTPLSRPVKQAYERFLREGYETAGPKQIWLNRLEETRAKVAAFLGVQANEIAFTKNTSESMNIAANALPLRAGDKVLMIHGDHPNNAYAFLNLQKKGVKV
jgi:selenocysteine lyase/cysteine desulfurase